MTHLRWLANLQRSLFWAPCLDATQYVYIAEIFPTHLRAAGTACGIAGLLCGTIIVLVAGPIALDRISWKVCVSATLALPEED